MLSEEQALKATGPGFQRQTPPAGVCLEPSPAKGGRRHGWAWQREQEGLRPESVFFLLASSRVASAMLCLARSILEGSFGDRLLSRWVSHQPGVLGKAGMMSPVIEGQRLREVR